MARAATVQSQNRTAISVPTLRTRLTSNPPPIIKQPSPPSPNCLRCRGGTAQGGRERDVADFDAAKRWNYAQEGAEAEGGRADDDKEPEGSALAGADERAA